MPHSWTPWTRKQEALVREHYLTRGAEELAAMTGHTPKAVRVRAQSLGAARRHRRVDAGRLPSLYARGLHDAALARALGCSHTAASRARRRLGLGPPHRPPGPSNKDWLRREGYPHLNAYHVERGRLEAEALWPGCGCTPGEARLLDMVRDLGEGADTLSLGRSLGRTHQYGRGSVWAVLWALHARGLVACSRRPGRGRLLFWELAGPAEVASARKAQREDLA